IAAEDELAIQLAAEGVDDHARDGLAACVLPQSGLHDVRNQRLDVDCLALPDFLFVEPDTGFDLLCHGFLPNPLGVLGFLAGMILSKSRRFFGIMRQPPQPPIVTLICREAERNVPSLNLATAITSWVAASRMRVDASGTLRAEKRNRITRAFGFAGASTRISCT